MHRTLFSLLTLVALSVSTFTQAEGPTQVPPNARVAIIGDSITEQKSYSKFIEAYLLACTGRKDIHCFQFGWGGETASGFKQREDNDLGVFHPTAATFCYGMNDCGYVPYKDNIGAGYEANMREVLRKAQAMGVRRTSSLAHPALWTPNISSEQAPRPTNTMTISSTSAPFDRKLAAELHTSFADVHKEMIDAMTEAKAALGADYDVCGGDGVHPQPNGHLLMAAAFLKGLGCDGNIGEITVDMKGASSGSTGHQTTGANGAADVSSTTWPFCFEGDAKSSSGTRSILPFCKFNEELNRLTLRVTNLDTPKAKVTWGAESKEFTQGAAEPRHQPRRRIHPDPVRQHLLHLHERRAPQAGV